VTEPVPPPYPPDFPASWAIDIVLADGRPAHLRPLVPDDAPLYLDLLDGLSPESRYYRFFTPKPKISDAEIAHFLNVDHHDRVAIVAIVDRAIVGVARFDREEADPTRAELAIAVADDMQGTGVGGALIAHLTTAAHDRHVETLLANVLSDNHKMLRLLAKTGRELHRSFDGGVMAITFSTDPAAHIGPHPADVADPGEPAAAGGST
jgi:RimJ/RimL family protein N-acetyltransferase